MAVTATMSLNYSTGPSNTKIRPTLILTNDGGSDAEITGIIPNCTMVGAQQETPDLSLATTTVAASGGTLTFTWPCHLNASGSSTGDPLQASFNVVIYYNDGSAAVATSTNSPSFTVWPDGTWSPVTAGQLRADDYRQSGLFWFMGWP